MNENYFYSLACLSGGVVLIAWSAWSMLTRDPELWHIVVNLTSTGFMLFGTLWGAWTFFCRARK